jgi:hypothetical protein
VHIAGAAIAGGDLVATHHQLGRGGAAATGTGVSPTQGASEQRGATEPTAIGTTSGRRRAAARNLR